MTVIIRDRGRKLKARVRRGEPVANALHQVGHHRDGHSFWHIWRGHHEIKPGHPVLRSMNVTIRHVQAGACPP
jgi:hypothetical protein